MRANNLSIVIPSTDKFGGIVCDKQCPYCVSQMTPLSNTTDLFSTNLEKARYLAEASQVSSVMITSKGEPMLNIPKVLETINFFSKFPLELQTNGIYLNNHLDAIPQLASHGLNVIAFSLDDISQFEQFSAMFHSIKQIGLIVRVTFNVLNKHREQISNIKDLFREAIVSGVDQLSLRKITVANNTKRNHVHKWIEENASDGFYDELYWQAKDYIRDNKCPKLRKLPFGAFVYAINGLLNDLSFTMFDYCIQDENDSEDIRSLIYDGGMYDSWGSLASRIF